MADSDDNSKELIAELRAELRAYQANLKLVMTRALTLLQAEILDNIRKKSGLTVRTGNLLNSVRGAANRKVERTHDGYEGGISSNTPYSRIHEFGGTIYPKNAKALLIPSKENRKRDGSPKVTAEELRNGLGKSFAWKGAIWLAERKSTTGKHAGMEWLKPMFWFAKSVTTPKRPYMGPALAAKRETILKEFGLFLSMSFDKKE